MKALDLREGLRDDRSTSLVSRSLIILLFSLVATVCATAATFEKFVPEPVAWNASPESGVLFGDSWVAYRPSRDVLRVVDRTTNAEIARLKQPTAAMPVDGKPGWTRYINDWGLRTAAYGNRLATLCSSTIYAEGSPFPGYTSGYSVLLWDIPSGQLLGIADLVITNGGSMPFVGLSAERLVVVGPYNHRKIYQWDASTMAALPTIPIPDSLPHPGSGYMTNGIPLIVVGGKRVVYEPSVFSTTPELVVADLESGTCSPLPTPSGLGLSGEVGLAIHGDRLLFGSRSFISTPVFSRFVHLLHYNLATLQVVAVTTFPENLATDTYATPVLHADGRWTVSPWTGGTDRSFFSGRFGESLPDVTFRYDSPDFPLGAPLAWIGDDIWFASPGGTKSDARAWILRSTTVPKSHLTAQVLPCEEKDGVLQIRVTLSNAIATDTTFRVRTSPGSAIPGSDYETVDAIHSIPAGATEVTVPVTVIKDQIIEPNESLFIEITDSGPDIIQTRTLYPAVIQGSSFDLLPPVVPYKDVPAMGPDRVHLAGGQLVQTNQIWSDSTPITTPAVVLRPFASGDWKPSTSWNRPLTAGSYIMELSASSNGLIAIKDNGSTTVFDPANDAVKHRVLGTAKSYGPDLLGSTHFLTPLATGTPVEYSLAAPSTTRVISRPSGNWIYLAATYTDDSLLVAGYSGAIERYSRADGSFQGMVFSSGPWDYQPTMASDGHYVAIAANGKVWIFPNDSPASVRKIETNTAITKVAFEGGYLFAWSGYDQSKPLVEVIEPVTGVVIDQIFRDIPATQLEGSVPLPVDTSGATYLFNSFSPEGNNAASLFAYQGQRRIARFSRGGNLPSLSSASVLREGDGNLSLSFTEASSWPLTITTRAIVAGYNQAEDWPASAATVTVPAGVTSFDSGLAPINDRLPENPEDIALEVTISGGGHTEVRRISTRLEDDDRIVIEDIAHTTPRLYRSFTAVGGAWAYCGFPGITWTRDDTFAVASPYAGSISSLFGEPMVSSGEWLAAAHDTWGGPFGISNPSSVILYKPGIQNSPVRTLKGMSVNNYFGRGLFARGNTLWVGAPGRYDTNGRKKIDVKGQAFEYDMNTGKRLRTYKPPTQHARAFGYRITANDSSVWFSSYDPVTGTSAVSQYSRAKGKWVRTLANPSPGPGLVFGGQLEANSDTLIATGSGRVRGFSTATGTLSWTITPPEDQEFRSIELIRDDLLAVGGNTVFLYQLDPGAEPVLLTEIWSYDRPITKLECGGHELMVYRGEFSDEKWTLIDLRDIPPLSSFFPPAPAPVTAATAAKVQEVQPANGIHFTKGADGMTMHFGADVALDTFPGMVLTLESSTDLDQWDTIARREPVVGWLPLVEWLGTAEGNSVKIQRDDQARYFRLRLTPVKE